MPKAASLEDIEVGRRLRLRRIELRMSQGEVASAIGVSFQQVQKYENGRNRITAGRITKLAEALDVPRSFFYEANTMSPDLSSALVGEKKLGVRLIQAFIKIKSERVQKRLLGMVEAMAEDQ